MDTYETSATVESEGRLHLAGVPFKPGTEVEVMIAPKRRSGEEFVAAWRKLCSELRSLPSIQNLSDEDIEEEIRAYRAGR